MINNIGNKIREAREKLGIDQDSFAEIIRHSGYKITYSMLSKYETNKSKPNSDLINIICKLCNVTPDWLLGYADNARVVELADTPDSKETVKACRIKYLRACVPKKRQKIIGFRHGFWPLQKIKKYLAFQIHR